MSENTSLRKKFTSHIRKNWVQNDHNLTDLSCVYSIIGYDVYKKSFDIFYIGSTKKLNSRYKSHGIPEKVQDLGYINILYYLPMDTDFYKYEIKLIKKLKPLLNKQHKN